MNVVFDKKVAEKLKDTYTVLSLPPITQTQGDQTVTVDPHVVIDMEMVPLQEISSLDQWTNLHEELVKNHIKKDWNFCKQAVEHLKGKFKGELDSYYDAVLNDMQDK
jgi:hypothetical protein